MSSKSLVEPNNHIQIGRASAIDRRWFWEQFLMNGALLSTATDGTALNKSPVLNSSDLREGRSAGEALDSQ